VSATLGRAVHRRRSWNRSAETAAGSSDKNELLEVQQDVRDAKADFGAICDALAPKKG
jgi:hypothetical protein